ncbi:MAG: terminase TerL endonuclease subunit [Litorimonas sp.]
MASVDRTTRYARDVVLGKIVAGRYVRLQAERHLRDLKEGKARGLTWDRAAAERAIGFFPAVLTISEGMKEGDPFELLPWHVFVVGSIFGWKDVNGLRRFRFVWLETGKGQAKSPLMAAIGLLLMSFSGIPRAKVFCIGQDKITARVIFADAVAMCRGPIPGHDGDTLESIGRITIRGTGDMAYKLEDKERGAKMEAIANTDSISGPRPTAVMGDEVHEMKTNKAVEIWRKAIAKMPGDPLMMLGTNTPSVDQQVGTDYSDYFQRVLRGEFEDDSAFAYIARVDKDDKPFKDESCWIKALPALGVTFPVENIRKEVETSRHSPATRLATERLYFGVPVGSAGFWISEEAWNGALGPVDEDEMRGRKLHLALDLSQKNDLTALSGCWEGEQLAVKTWYWSRDYEVEKRTTADHIQYRDLAAEGLITLVPGRVIEYDFIAVQVRDLCAAHDVEQLVVDSAYIEDFMRACRDIGFPVWLWEGEGEPEGQGLKIVRHAQGKRVVFEDKMLCMPVSIRHLEDRILKDTITIDANKITTICASNTVVDSDAQKNKCFDKARSRGRIDGMVTIAMSVGAARAEMEGRAASVYETRGLRVLA